MEAAKWALLATKTMNQRFFARSWASDGSAPDYVDTTLNNQAGSTGGAYTFIYKAGSSGQQLVITFTQNDNNGGNVTLQASTLQ